MTGLVSLYPEFKLSYSAQIPDQLRDLIYSVWQYRYQELYEDHADAPVSLEQSCENILDHLISYNSNSSYLYLMWMGLILGLSVQPTLTAYLPNDPRSELILNLALSHFIRTKNQIKYYKNFNFKENLEGYAIFPGSQHRRDLFNWWLLDVVPGIWCLKCPKKIYTIKGLKRFTSEQFFEI
jgi:hypothetical protein